MNRDKKEDNSINRRNILKNVGAATVGTVSVVDITEAGKGRETKRSVTELEGKDKKKIISQARSDSEVKLIERKFKNNGWDTNISIQ